MIWDHLSPEDDKKAKKSLLIVSAITIFVAGIEITSDEIQVLGFAVRIPQEKLIAAGRVLSALMLLVFLARSLPIYASSIFEIFKRAMQSKHERETLNLQLDWGYDEYPDFDNSPSGEFDELEYRQRTQRKLLDEKMNFLSILSKSLSVLVVDYSIPVLIGFIAICSPEYPSQKLIPEMSAENTGVEVFTAPESSDLVQKPLEV